MSNDCKPFSILHARAGAPYACRNGREATILKWDCRDPKFKLAGVMGINDESNEWLADGRNNIVFGEDEFDLVMIPLGEIDGKPVFVGDEIVSVKDGSTHTAYPTQRNFVGAFWPEPAQQYPVTGMTVEEISDAWGPEFGWTGMRNFADKVLRHAIDNATVATREAYDQCRADLLAAESKLIELSQQHAELRRLVNHDATLVRFQPYTESPEGIANAKQAARELAIAEEVAKATYNRLYATHRVAYCDMGLDLAGIIADVPA